MTLIKELINIPETVHKGDFVLRLTEGVDHAEQTLAEYVVTPELVRNFEDALSFIKKAISDRSSKATYLDGSFGSGKSHFMAVLHLLLQGNAQARSIPELAPVVAASDSWLGQKKFLLIPYHMIGARSIESAVLGGYAAYVSEHHPGCPTPAVFKAEQLFDNARQLREQMDDEKFFGALNQGNEGGDGDWGDLEQTWDAGSFDAAISAPPKDERRHRLVSDLVSTLLSSYQQAVSGQGESFVSLDEGLAVISQHAQTLGYDALILFLDELVLWLASNASDPGFISRQIQGAVKLIEAQSSDRPIPIVSVVARQRDLRELVGDHVPGAQELAYVDQLKHWEGRFHKIGLLDRNLPAIAEKRVLKPVSAAAKAELDGAFAATLKARQEVIEVLQTSQADQEMFRRVYPFSPALVTTLVAVSSALQRERTAIKVMLQLLVNQRDTLELGDVVPVGDLFDVIAEGDEAFSEGMRQHFDNAKRLYHQKLLPMLEAEHGIKVEDLRGGDTDPAKARVFRNDDRLVKTLLLSALAPEVEPLKNLTASRIAALNHGTIKAPIAGRESTVVLNKFRTWAARVGEIKVSEDDNPTISLQLSGVDVETILEKGKIADNAGERRKKIRELIFRDLGIDDRDGLFQTHEFLFRNTRRQCDVIFANVRADLPDDSLRAAGERWKVIIDFPFDDSGYTPRDDIARLDNFRDNAEPSRTLVWIPSFFSPEAQKELGTLVVLEHILSGERFNDYASHLMAADRASAKQLLDNQRSQLKQRIHAHLEAAYGVSSQRSGVVESAHELNEHVQSLDPTFSPQLPVGNNLAQAFQHLLDQALSHQYPAHPKFEAEIKLPAVRKVYDEISNLDEPGERRIAIDSAMRPLMRQIAVPLGLGDMGETHFVLQDRWIDSFRRFRSQADGALTVSKLRDWTDEPEPMGLPSWVQNLLILHYANQENLRFKLHGGPPGDVGVDLLRDELSLESVELPSSEQWQLARERGSTILGLSPMQHCNATNVASFADEIVRTLDAHRDACSKVRSKLDKHMRALALDPTATDRYKTASATLGLVESVTSGMSPTEVVRAVAAAEVETTETAMGSSLKKADEIVGGLDTLSWKLFEGLAQLTDDRQGGAQALLARARTALEADEYATALLPALRAAQDEAVNILAPAEPKPASATPTPVPPAPSNPPQLRLEGTEEGLDSDKAREAVAAIVQAIDASPGARVDIRWKVRKG